MVWQETAGALEPQCAPAQGRATHYRLAAGARDGAVGLSRFFAENGGYRIAVLRRSLDRCTHSPGQGARRILAPDRAFGPSLCAAQLPGQAARRDDTRA